MDQAIDAKSKRQPTDQDQPHRGRLPDKLRYRSGNKFGNRKTHAFGKVFDSQAEANRYGDLRMLKKAGEICDLECQPKFELQEKFERHGKKYRAITYRADFQYTEVGSGKVKVEDVKGYATEAFKIKALLFRYKYPDIEFVVHDV